MPSVAIETHTLSGPKRVDFSVYRGDSGMFRITVKEEDDTPIDISGATWDADIRYKADDPDPVTSFQVTPVVGDVSSIDVILSAEKAALIEKRATYDVEMTMGGQVVTLVYGVLAVTKDVSRT